jgi:GNAT superfamily N-acetyltransferase
VDGAVDVYVRGGAARRGVPASSERIEQVRSMLHAADSWFFVALSRDMPVGMAACLPYREDSGAGDLVSGWCYLDLVFVVPERWGEGIGGVLIDTVARDARGRGYKRMLLWTHDDNDRAQRLYASRGFQRTGVTRLSLDPAMGQVSEWAVAI